MTPIPFVTAVSTLAMPGFISFRFGPIFPLELAS
jgi:hypothetical protein